LKCANKWSQTYKAIVDVTALIFSWSYCCMQYDRLFGCWHDGVICLWWSALYLYRTAHLTAKVSEQV